MRPDNSPQHALPPAASGSWADHCVTLSVTLTAYASFAIHRWACSYTLGLNNNDIGMKTEWWQPRRTRGWLNGAINRGPRCGTRSTTQAHPGQSNAHTLAPLARSRGACRAVVPTAASAIGRSF